MRSIIEETLQEVMFDVPSNHKISKVIISDKVIDANESPEFIYNENREPVVITINEPEKVIENNTKTYKNAVS